VFEPTSRYYSIETATMTSASGQVLAYKRRRFIPRGPDQLLAEVLVTQGDRLDIITARTLGDPEQFWRLCDANPILDPGELIAHPGRRIRVARPRA
jgi:hypothetical protein